MRTLPLTQQQAAYKYNFHCFDITSLTVTQQQKNDKKRKRHICTAVNEAGVQDMDHHLWSCSDLHHDLHP